ncbi:serine hydrolase [Alkalicoccobacillus gibsonii]|uniref:Serine hydrolase n=1 Tax=Alkalicoccobacillus gibsonii TaxID=79881 RepID=A0ABU9VEX4_9BACI
MKTNKGTIVFIILWLSIFLYPLNTKASGQETPSGIPISDIEATIDEYVDEWVENTVAGVSVEVIKNHEVVFSKGYGLADIDQNMDMNPDETIMEWGSVSKLLVWVSLMQLAEQGELDLTDDIQPYLPDGFLTKVSREEPITFLNLMNHTAGFEDNVFDLGFPTPEHVTTLEEGLKVAEPNQVYPPGEVVAYSNYSTALAAFIVEQVTGEPFYEYVENEIFEPLNMNHTVIHPTFSGKEDLMEKKAKGYVLIEPSVFIESDWFYMSMYPSGGVNGTASDLTAFVQALLPMDGESSPLFKEHETLNQFLSQSYAADETINGIAHGLWEYAGAARGLYHGGNTNSFSSHVHLVPDEEFAVVVLTNQAGEMEINYGLTELLVGAERVEQEVMVQDLPPAIEGSFLATRRPQHSFIKLYFDLMPFTIKPSEEDKIEVQYAGFTGTYLQTSPNTYKLVEGDLVFHSMKQLFVQMENAKVSKISTSISDYEPYPPGKSMPYVLIYGILASIVALYFLVIPIILLIKRIRRQSKHRMSKVSIGHGILALSGTVLIVNLLILVARMLINAGRAYSEVMPQLVLNGIFTGIAGVAMLFMIVNWRITRSTTKEKIMYMLSIIFIVVLIILMSVFQFYR